MDNVKYLIFRANGDFDLNRMIDSTSTEMERCIIRCLIFETEIDGGSRPVTVRRMIDNACFITPPISPFTFFQLG